jgi:hypothetical protein
MELSWPLLKRSPVVRSLDSFAAFYGTRRFNTEFTRTLHLSLSWATPIQSTSPHPTSTRSILILSNHLRLGLPSGSFPQAFLPTTYTRSSSPHSCYMPRPSHPLLLSYSKNTWRRVQIMKLFIMQFYYYYYYYYYYYIKTFPIFNSYKYKILFWRTVCNLYLSSWTVLICVIIYISYNIMFVFYSSMCAFLVSVNGLSWFSYFSLFSFICMTPCLVDV